ncbi:MAG: hypothetical protein LC721_10975, partial [Actinobacteria bacterium]|nr:hypothetical protein [Actinomycetota bacterium]
ALGNPRADVAGTLGVRGILPRTRPGTDAVIGSSEDRCEPRGLTPHPVRGSSLRKAKHHASSATPCPGVTELLA